VKRLELIATLQRSGCVLLRHGNKHDIYPNYAPVRPRSVSPSTGQAASSFRAEKGDTPVVRDTTLGV
jgi:hypothetical protein